MAEDDDGDGAVHGLVRIAIRHGELIDKKFLEGLTDREIKELVQINRMLDAEEESYFASIKADIVMIGEMRHG